MANEKIMNSRQQQKHDLEINWLKATNFIPKEGEIIVYDAEEEGNYSHLYDEINNISTNRENYILYPRIKIGDGKTIVKDLPFVQDPTIISAVGQLTPEGGEIFNDYDWNLALGLASSASNKETFSGVRGYYFHWEDGDPLNVITLDIAEGETVEWKEHINNTENFIMSNRSYVYFIRTDTNETRCATGQTLIDIIDGKKIKVGTKTSAIPFTADERANFPSNKWIAFNPQRPRVGNVEIIANGAHAEGYQTAALGEASHAEGRRTIARAAYTHVEGSYSTATGENAHAEGYNTSVSGKNGHAEGQATKANGTNSHAEGINTVASGAQSHAEGQKTTASGQDSHAEGNSTTASAAYTHAEGYNTKATATRAHAEGQGSEASGQASHAEGGSSKASGLYSHAEGNSTVASGESAHAEGYKTQATYNYSHAEGQATKAFNDNAHAEGQESIASGVTSHAEGHTTTASGSYSHSEGYVSHATNTAAHSEGSNTTASGTYSHAEGQESTASGQAAHAEGYITKASGQFAHAEGQNTAARRQAAHAEGKDTIANATGAHAEGVGTITIDSPHENAYGQHVQGRYNIQDTATHSKYAHIVGNGTDDANRSNAHTIDWSGNAWFAGNIKIGGSTYDSSSAKTVATTDEIQQLKNSIGNLSNVMNFVGATTTEIKDGITVSINKPTGIAESSYVQQSGDVVIDSKGQECVFDGTTWRHIGDASYAARAGTAQSATNAEHATTADTAQSAEYAATANTADFATSADEAQHALNAEDAINAINAEYANHATQAETANTAIHANTATKAEQLDISTNVGSANNPVYFEASGKPVAIDYTIESNVPADAVFTDTTYNTFNTTENGLVPKPSTASTSMYLRADGKWSTPKSVGASTAEGGEIFNDYAHNEATRGYTHAEGLGTKATGSASHAEGKSTVAGGDNSHAEGYATKASGQFSHAEGQSTNALAENAHAEGQETTASGLTSHAEGHTTTASGWYAHSEGYVSHATGTAAHSEGQETTASGEYGAHAEGRETLASGQASHAEGYQTKALNPNAHAEGQLTESRGQASHAEGYGTKTYYGTEIAKSPQHVQGRYNIIDETGKYAHIVGGGILKPGITPDYVTGQTVWAKEENIIRKNIHTIDWEGNTWFAKDIKIGGTGQDDANAKILATQEYVDGKISEIDISDAVTMDEFNNALEPLEEQVSTLDGVIYGLSNLVEQMPIGLLQNLSTVIVESGSSFISTYSGDIPYYFRKYIDGRADLFISTTVNIDMPSNSFTTNATIPLPFEIYKYAINNNSLDDQEEFIQPIVQVTTHDIVDSNGVFTDAIVLTRHFNFTNTDEDLAAADYISNLLQIGFLVKDGSNLSSFTCDIHINGLWDSYYN